ncbi:hypothetical protein GCM10010272_68590 [Streptomyces lateritius]|nr:hypothetical protein GCM10010272_68590 [Streptomyces lateritius]
MNFPRIRLSWCRTESRLPSWSNSSSESPKTSPGGAHNRRPYSRSRAQEAKTTPDLRGDKRQDKQQAKAGGE